MHTHAHRTSRHMTRAITGALLLVVGLGLAACQADLSAESGRAVARKSLHIDESIAAFADLCLADGFTKADITRVAEKYDFGISEPSDLKRDGKSEFVILGQADEATGRYNNYGCAIGFQGAWSDEIVTDVARTLAARGFKASAPFTRETGRGIYPPVDEINHKAVYTRAGKPYAVSIQSRLPGRTETHRYIANTILMVLAS